MSPGLLTPIFAVFTLMVLGAGVWLALHLTALTALFNGKADIVAAPKRPRAARGTVIGALAIFGVGLAGVLASQIAAINS